MHIRRYIPISDSLKIYELGKKLFSYSKFYCLETVENFNHYSGWVIEDNDNNIVAFLLYSFQNSESAYYIDFIGSSHKGCGQILLSTFLDFVKNDNTYLHVEHGCDNRVSKLVNWYQKNGFVISNKPITIPLLCPVNETITMIRCVQKSHKHTIECVG